MPRNFTIALLATISAPLIVNAVKLQMKDKSCAAGEFYKGNH
jgi:hypothetical protein